MIRSRPLLLLSLLLIAIFGSTAKATTASPCSSAVCRSKFKILFITSTHTWINHGCPCLAGGRCPYTGPASWTTCGFEATNRLPVGPGGLRQETYQCTDPQPSTVASTDCYRLAIQRLVEAGWNDGKKAPYRIWKGLTSCADITVKPDCGPNPSGNVCWKFTCAAVDCELPKIPPQSCPQASDDNWLVENTITWPSDEKVVVIESQWPMHELDKLADGVCDCREGAYITDPDCYHPSSPSRGCKGRDMCVPGNQCLPREAVLMDRKINRVLDDGLDVWNPNRHSPYTWRPLEELSWSQYLISLFGHWTCPLSYYGSNDGCDVGCGEPDPDCKDFDAKRYREWFPSLGYEDWQKARLGYWKPEDFPVTCAEGSCAFHLD